MRVEYILIAIGVFLASPALYLFVRAEVNYRTRHRHLRFHWTKSRAFDTRRVTDEEQSEL